MKNRETSMGLCMVLLAVSIMLLNIFFENTNIRDAEIKLDQDAFYIYGVFVRTFAFIFMSLLFTGALFLIIGNFKDKDK